MKEDITTMTNNATWASELGLEKQQPYFQKLMAFITAERSKKIIYPPQADVFNALKQTSLQDTKVVIIGQDPYHGPGQAHGLAFSVKPGVPLPPSLKNIFLELKQDLGINISQNGCLIPWAQQGVLLLNAVLTVEAGKPQSHAKIGWERFTDKVIQILNDKKEGLVFLLWGAYAQRKGEVINPQKHFILKSAHPSPFSVKGFFGCHHFSKTNDILTRQAKPLINWDLTVIK